MSMDIKTEILKSDSHNTETKVDIKFNEQALKKYKCSSLVLEMFHEDYKNAVAYYKNKNDKKIIVGTFFTIVGIGFTILGLGNIAYTSMILKDTLHSQIALLTTGAAISLTTCGFSLCKYGKLSNEMEYDLSRKNPYIYDGTSFKNMAEDYANLKMMSKKKNRF